MYTDACTINIFDIPKITIDNSYMDPDNTKINNQINCGTFNIENSNELIIKNILFDSVLINTENKPLVTTKDVL